MSSVDDHGSPGARTSGHKGKSSDGGESSSTSSRRGEDKSRRKHSSTRHRSSRKDRSPSPSPGNPPAQSGVLPRPLQLSPSPSPSRRDAQTPPWATVLDAVAALRSDMEKLKTERQQGTLDSHHTVSGSRHPATSGSAYACLDDPPLSQFPEAEVPGSIAGFSGFRPDDDDDSEEGEIHDSPVRSALLQGAKTYGPIDCVSADVDTQVADMVNHLFDKGMREDDYRDVLEDDITKRPSNCHALDPVECNAQILEALKPDAKRADFRMKDVGKDLLKAATIIVKSLTVLDKFAQEEGNAVVAHEVSLLNGALALLGNANHRNNLARRFVIKREINHKYAHLCSEKVPMTRYLFGDDVSQSAKQIEEAERLKSKFSTRKAFSTWKFGSSKPVGGKTRPFPG